MNLKKKRKELRHLIGWGFFKIIEWLISHSPLSILYFLSEKLGCIIYYLPILGYKKRVLKHLDFVFGREKNNAEKKEIAKGVGKNLFKVFLEMQHVAYLSEEKIRNLISMEGRGNINAALAKGKGVIAISAHLGNFAILGAKLAVEGYAFNIIVKDPKDPRIASRLREHGSEVSSRFAIIPFKPQEQCIKRTLKCLRNNEIVCFIVDENKPSGGVFVDFFGHPAATATGPAIFSLRTGAAIVPMFIIRQEDNKNRVIIEPSIDIERTGDKKKDILSITARFTKVIEDYIRRYPSQWSWINKRWKTQPE